jgi:hypothetical protein
MRTGNRTSATACQCAPPHIISHHTTRHTTQHVTPCHNTPCHVTSCLPPHAAPHVPCPVTSRAWSRPCWRPCGRCPAAGGPGDGSARGQPGSAAAATSPENPAALRGGGRRRLLCVLCIHHAHRGQRGEIEKKKQVKISRLFDLKSKVIQQNKISTAHEGLGKQRELLQVAFKKEEEEEEEEEEEDIRTCPAQYHPESPDKGCCLLRCPCSAPAGRGRFRG